MISPINNPTEIPLSLLIVILVGIIVVIIACVIGKKREKRIERESAELGEAIDSWLQECAKLTNEYKRNHPEWREHV